MSSIAAIYTPAAGARLPVVTDQCASCQQRVELAQQDTYTVACVRPGRRARYAPRHNLCATSTAVPLDAA